jgi:Arc/MetJ-type ribon-helix-helix transcriptional regulator
VSVLQSGFVKILTVRLPEPLVAEIEAESRARRISRSDVVRDRLSSRGNRRQTSVVPIADLIGSVDALPADLSARRKAYLKSTRYGQKRPR